MPFSGLSSPFTTHARCTYICIPSRGVSLRTYSYIHRRIHGLSSGSVCALRCTIHWSQCGAKSSGPISRLPGHSPALFFSLVPTASVSCLISLSLFSLSVMIRRMHGGFLYLSTIHLSCVCLSVYLRVYLSCQSLCLSTCVACVSPLEKHWWGKDFSRKAGRRRSGEVSLSRLVEDRFARVCVDSVTGGLPSLLSL